MADPKVIYPFDPTGQASTNRVVGEQITILPPGDRLFHYTMPKFAPFFEEGHSLKLRDLNGNIIPLTLGVDYYFGHKFMDASLATMHPLFGSISFLRRDIAGVLIMDYQHLGGIWTIDSATITEILLNTYRNPRITSWEQVVERPVDFPVIDHKWNLEDMVGQKEILAVMQKFYTAYLASLDPDGSGGVGIIAEHIDNKNNPHEVTAAQLNVYTTLQMNTILAEFVRKTETAADSAKLGGKTLPEIMAQIADVKLDRAVLADRATDADHAEKASDSERLGGKSLTELMQDAAAATVANSQRLGGKTLSEVSTDILKGKAADSEKFNGKTLQEIIAQIQQSTGDATSLEGRKLADIMNDVKQVLVEYAKRAEMADDSVLLDGKNLSQILALVSATIPDLARNAERVYGYSFQQLIESILGSSEWTNALPYMADLTILEGVVVQNPANGGTQDPLYTYAMIGEFPIPLTGVNNDVFDPTAKRYSSSLESMFFFKDKTLRISANVTIRDDQSMVLDYFANQSLNDSIQLGVRNVDSTIKSADGTKTAKFAQVYLKFKTADVLRRFGTFQFMKNSFVLASPDDPVLWNSTNVALNSVVWQLPTSSGGGGSTVELEVLANDLNAMLQTPAV
jgi:hypothetical protein